MSSSSKLSHESFGIGALFDRLDDAVLVLDPALARIVIGNPAAERLFGFCEDELAGLPLARLFPAGLPTAPQGPVEVDARSQAGDERWVEVTLSPIGNRRVPGAFLLAVVRDVAERKRFRAALEASEARFRAFMDFGPAIASMRDEQGRYVYTNALHRRLFGSQDWIGTTVHEQLPEEIAAKVLADDRYVLLTGAPADFEEQMPGPDQLHTLLVFKFPFDDGAGHRLIGSLGMDVTPLKQAQAALLERTKALEAANQALRAADAYKDEFLSVLSHELRTPITTIYGFIELLEDGAAGPLSPSQRDFVLQVERGIQRLLTLVNDLIDFAHLQAGVFPLNVQPVDGVSTLRDAAESFRAQAREAGIAFHVEVPQAPLQAEIDPQQIARVVRSLVSNALKYTPAGGTVTVKATRQGATLLTEVTDTGIGIAPADVPKLFDRFWQFDTSSTRVEGGLGLGLPIAKAIVEGHGGTIGARSTLGKGSTFWFTLEVEPAPRR